METIRVWEGVKGETENIKITEFQGKELGVLRTFLGEMTKRWYNTIYRLYQTDEETYILVEIETAAYTQQATIHRFNHLDEAAERGFAAVLLEMYALDCDFEEWRESWSNR